MFDLGLLIFCKKFVERLIGEELKSIVINVEEKENI